MNTIKKVSDIAVTDVADYIKIGELDDNDNRTLANYIEISKSFIRSYTGLTDEQIDKHSDFIIVVLILCQDMYDNKTMYVDESNLNYTVECILGMHCVNLL